MKGLGFLFIPLLSLGLHAGEVPRKNDVEKESWILTDGKKELLTRVPLASLSVRLSASCLGKNGEFQCEAGRSALKTQAPTFLPQWGSTQEGGAEPGSRLCRETFRGRVLFGRNQRGDVNAFCAFPDASIISTGSLYSLYQRAHLNPKAAR